MHARIVGLGQRAAGDDGVGLVVVARLRAAALPEGIEAREVADATALLPLLETQARVVLVDAALGDPPGRVLALGPERLGDLARPLSSHGLDVGQALALARTLYPATVASSIAVVAVTIGRPTRHGQGLSPEVAAAVPEAAACALRLAQEAGDA